MLSLLLSRTGIVGIICALVLGVITVQSLRLAHAKHDLSDARSALKSASADVQLSEQRRAVEHAGAVQDASAADAACAARVAQAHRSADRIRTLVEKPHATDPKTRCPVRAMLSARELRDAIHPGT